MSYSKTAYRAVNHYICYDTGEDLYRVSKVYEEPGHARAYATRMRHPRGKHHPAAKIANPAKHGSFFEFVDTWCERASEWTRI